MFNLYIERLLINSYFQDIETHNIIIFRHMISMQMNNIFIQALL